jgi:hypothetical protein
MNLGQKASHVFRFVEMSVVFKREADYPKRWYLFARLRGVNMQNNNQSATARCQRQTTTVG